MHIIEKTKRNLLRELGLTVYWCEQVCRRLPVVLCWSTVWWIPLLDTQPIARLTALLQPTKNKHLKNIP